MKISELGDMWLREELERQLTCLRHYKRYAPNYESATRSYDLQIAKMAVVRKKIVALIEEEIAKSLTPNEDMNQN